MGGTAFVKIFGVELVIKIGMGGTAFVKIFGVELVIKICVGLVRKLVHQECKIIWDGAL